MAAAGHTLSSKAQNAHHTLVAVCQQHVGGPYMLVVHEQNVHSEGTGVSLGCGLHMLCFISSGPVPAANSCCTSVPLTLRRCAEHVR